MSLQHSRVDRLVFYLSKVISEEDALKVYNRLDELPDYVCVAIDKAIYEDLAYDGIIVDLLN
jgi:hypothetical protein